MISRNFMRFVSNELRTGTRKITCDSSMITTKKSLANKSYGKQSQSDKNTRSTCSTPSIGINGFGRIGKCVLRLAAINDINVVAVNQPYVTGAKIIGDSLNKDTVHGPFSGSVTYNENTLCVKNKLIRVLHEEDPAQINWKEAKVDYVIEASGKFTEMEKARKHLLGGAKKVIVAASSHDIPMFVKGVNYESYRKTEMVVANGSCTTNCAAPLLHIMNKKFGVVNCLLTSSHATTASQKIHDGLKQRATLGNMIPRHTGAADAIGHIITDLKYKVDGDAVRVPILDVSLLKLYINLKNEASPTDIKNEIKNQTECGVISGQVTYYDEGKFVSSDFLGSQYSTIVDFNQIQVIDKFISIGAWYDNEMGYAHRILDLVEYMMQRDQEK